MQPWFAMMASISACRKARQSLSIPAINGFPGGKIEPGETPQQALARELMEEMEYPVEVGEELVTVNHEYPDFSITMTAFLCTPKGDANGFKRREHADSKWCSKDELKGLNWAAADIDVVEGIL